MAISPEHRSRMRLAILSYIE